MVDVYSRQHFCGDGEYTVTVRFHDGSYFLGIKMGDASVVFSGPPVVIKQLIETINREAREVMYHDA